MWANGVMRCPCGDFLTAQTCQAHCRVSGHSFIDPTGEKIGSGVITTPRPTAAPPDPARHATRPAPPAAATPHYGHSATARICPRPAGCGRRFESFATLLSHLASTECGNKLDDLTLVGLGVEKCLRGNQRHMCGVLFETHTVSGRATHNEVCRYNVRGGHRPLPEDFQRNRAQHAPEVEEVVLPWDLLMAIPLRDLVFSAGPSIKAIPVGLENLFTACFTLAAKEAMGASTASRGYRLLMAITPMLLPNDRGRAKSVRVAVKARCQAFLSGEWEDLLHYARNPVRTTAPPRTGGDRSAKQTAQVLELCAAGELSKATQKLPGVQAEMVEPTQESLIQLRALHPSPNPQFPRATFEPSDVGPLILDREAFEAYMEALPRVRAPGNTGFRHGHLSSVMGAGGGDTLYDLFNHMVAGGIPADVRPFFGGARLFALAKGHGGVRPIACGEVLRRVVASIVARQLRPAVGEYFAASPQRGVATPVQVGVGTRGGSDIMLHAIGAALDQHPEWVLLMVDYTNAFNTVSRTRFLEEVHRLFPELYPFVLSCYEMDPFMVYGVADADGVLTPQSIMSQEGCQQGDPLGPILFSLVLHIVMLEVLRSHPSLPISVSYLDDGSLLGPPQVVAQAFETLVTQSEALAGLTVNMHKCAVYSRDETADMSIFPQGLQGVETRKEGLLVLGLPVGDERYVVRELAEIARKAASPIEAINRLGAPQEAHLLLTACVRTRINHALRICKPALCTQAMDSFHKDIMRAFSGPASGIMRGPALDDLAADLATLPVGMGGGGLVRGKRIANAALVGSFALVWSEVLRLWPHVFARDALITAEPGEGLLGAVALAHAQLTTEAGEVNAWRTALPRGSVIPRNTYTGTDIPTLESISRAPARNVQYMLSAITATADYIGLSTNAELGDARTKAWFKSRTSPHSLGQGFMECIPSHTTLKLKPAEFTAAARMLYCQPQPCLGNVTDCKACRGGVDPEAQHFLSCKPPRLWGQGNIYCRAHDAVAATLTSLVKQVFPGEQRVTQEDKRLRHLSQDHIADIVVREYNEKGDTLHIEVSLLRPFTNQHIKLASEGNAASALERLRRTNHYSRLAPGNIMVPYVSDTFGCLGPESAAFITSLANAQKSDGFPRWGTQARRRLSMTLARVTALTIIERAAAENSGAQAHTNIPFHAGYRT
jgi:hypothetical protein